MAGGTHEGGRTRPRSEDGDRGSDNRRGIQLVLALVAVLVVAALALGAMVLNRGGVADDAGWQLGGGQDTTGGSAEEALDIASSEPAGADAEPCPSPSGGIPSPTSTPYDEPPQADLGGAETVRITVETTCGAIVLDLDAAAAPTTVGNFVALAEEDYYDGVGFHRVIDGFMIQGGDPTGTGTGCLDAACEQRLPGYTFEDELELAERMVADRGGYPRGTLAMANPGPDTNGSQFFIVQGAPGYPLPPTYTVFGSVVEGMDVVDRIAQGPVDGQSAIDPVRIITIQVER